MDIYKLTDIPDGDLTKHKKYDKMEVEALSGAGVSGGELKIMDMRQAVKNQNRVNVFVNDEYAFSLDIAQVVDLGVKRGAVITEEQLAEYKNASEFGKLYQRALEWALLRPRSEKETRDYLRRKVYDKKLDKRYVDDVLETLKNKKYVDDEKFTRWYVDNRFVKKGVSVKRLKMELVRKGISNDVIEDVLDVSERDEEVEIRKMATRKRSKYDDEKLVAYLCRQGFPYDLVKKIVEELE